MPSCRSRFRLVLQNKHRGQQALHEAINIQCWALLLLWSSEGKIMHLSYCWWLVSSRDTAVDKLLNTTVQTPMLYLSTRGSFSPVNMHPLGPRAGELTKRSDCHETGESRWNSKQQRTERRHKDTSQVAFVSSYQQCQVILAKNKITAEADCITGNPLLLKRQGIGTSILQPLLWGSPGSAGDRFHLVTWLEIERTPNTVWKQ